MIENATHVQPCAFAPGTLVMKGGCRARRRAELAYILDTFPIVRRKDEALYGEYRTKRMVLEK